MTAEQLKTRPAPEQPLLQIRGLRTHFLTESGVAKAVDKGMSITEVTLVEKTKEPA